MTALLELFDNAVNQYGQEAKQLRFLPEQRYNRTIFPTIGQYDWLSGQLLYCLIRFVRPVRIIEVSANSGYSSLFSGLALRANGSGQLETFELVPQIAASAQANFERFGITEFVRLHVGDARETASKLLNDRKTNVEKEILFLDSEHTEEFARFYLDTFLPDSHPESLFHMHDILPLQAKVMYRPGEVMTTSRFRWKSRLYRTIYKLTQRSKPADIRRWVKPVYFDPTLHSSEARLGHRLSAQIPVETQVYVHDIRDRYPVLHGRDFDQTSVWRCDDRGNPMEWNEAWWTTCGALRKVYF
jgi:predicted O-methyltransferase YrrM